MANPTVYVVHCVDAEGPPHQAYADQLDSWERMNSFYSEATSTEFRNRHSDLTGQGWIYNWFITDHSDDPYRNRPAPLRSNESSHPVHDYYAQLAQANSPSLDELHWHFRPISAYARSDESPTTLLHYPQMIDILARQILERGWFPACFRPGAYAERPDTHWLLEQWIPFDYANRSVSRYRGMKRSSEHEEGAALEWRRAVWDWSHYRPSYDDIQREGACSRTIFKCLPTSKHDRQLNQTETELAFRRADEGLPTVLAFSSHDSSELRSSVEYVYGLLKEAERKYPNVRWEHSGALNAARQSLGLRDTRPLELDAEFQRTASGLQLKVRSNKDTFGSQPFLALKTKDGCFHLGSFEILSPKREWICTFDPSFLTPESLSRIGIAANDAYGNVHVSLFQGDGSPILPLPILHNLVSESDNTLSNEEMIG